jgi:molybdate transport system permease protein
MNFTVEEWQALRLSAIVASVATGCGLPLATALGWVLARKQFAGKWLVEALVQLPLILPPVVPGFLLLLLFGTRGPVGQWLQENFDVVVAFSTSGAVLAATVMSFPLMVQPIRLAFRLADRRLDLAAWTLGCTPWQTFYRVTLPLAAPGILGGAVLGFSRCLGEFGATMAFVGNIPGETRTLPLALYSALQVPGGDIPALRIALLSMGLALLALMLNAALTQRLERRLGLQHETREPRE